MKLLTARESFSLGKLSALEVRPVPGRNSEYFLIVYGVEGKTFILASDDTDTSISSANIGHLLCLGRFIGFKEAIVIL